MSRTDAAPSGSPTASERRFGAFISYSQDPDGAIASRLQHALERLGRPFWRWSPQVPIYRDRTTMTGSAGLPTTLRTALDASDWLVVVCSPSSAGNPWVGKEIQWWLETRRADRILLVLIDGEIVWDDAAKEFDWRRSTAVHPALHAAFGEEPRYVDLRTLGGERPRRRLTLRSRRFVDRVAEIAAAIRGVDKDALVGAHHRERRRLRMALFATLLVVVGLVSAWQLQRQVAEQRELEAASRRLANLSRSVQGDDGALRYLLAAEAWKRDQTTEAAGALLDAAAAGDSGRLRTTGANDVALRLVGHRPHAVDVAISPDGGRAATLDAQGTVRVFDLAESSSPATLDGGPFAAITMVSDERVAALRADSVSWHDAGGAEIDSRDVPLGGLAMASARDGDVVIIGFDDGSVRRVEPDGEIVTAPGQRRSVVTTVDLSDDGQTVMTAGGPAVVMHDPDTLAPQSEWTASGNAVALSPDGSSVAVLRGDGLDFAGSGDVPLVDIVDATSGSVRTTLRTSEYLVPVAASFATADHLAIVTNGGVDGAPGLGHLFEIATGEAQAQGLAAPEQAMSIATSSAADVALVGGMDPVVYGTALGVGAPTDPAQDRGVIRQVTMPDGLDVSDPLSAAGDYVVAADTEGVAVVDLSSDNVVLRVSDVAGGVLAPGGDRLVTDDGRVLSVPDGAPAPGDLGGPIDLRVMPAFSATGETIAAVRANPDNAGPQEVAIAEVAADDSTTTVPLEAPVCVDDCAVGSLLALSPSASRLAVRSSSIDGGAGQLTVYEGDGGWEVASATPFATQGAVVFLDDNTIAAQDGALVRIVEASTGQEAPDATNLDDQGSWHLSADRALLAVAGDCATQLVDPASWTRVAEVARVQAVTEAGCDGTSAAWMGDGSVLLTASVDGVRQWTTDPNRLFDHACAQAGRNLTEAEWQQYLPQWTYEPTCRNYVDSPAQNSASDAAAGSADGAPADAPAEDTAAEPDAAPPEQGDTNDATSGAVHKLSQADLTNATYTTDVAGPVTLTDGTFRDEATFATVTLTEHQIVRDLDGDGDQDAAVIITENGGGSGTFFRLKLMLAEERGLTEAATRPLGDRTVIQSFAIKNGTIIVRTLQSRPTDGLASPTQRVVERFPLSQLLPDR